MLAGSTAIAAGVAALLVRAFLGSPALARLRPDLLVLWGGVAFPLAVLAALVAAALALGERLLPGTAPLRIEAVARQWAWDFAYPDAGTASTGVLHLPAGRDVDLAVTSADVIHSLWVPRLGGKIDAIPGHVNLIRLHADAPGRYHGQCAEFCGTGHAAMPFLVEAHPADAYAARLREAVR
jgi:cytochrome c oxidase subunit 2